MKTLVVSILSFAISTVVFAQSAPVDCYKLALNDSDLMPMYKEHAKSFGGKYELALEDEIVRLCSTATKASSPVTCYKMALADSAILDSYKSRATSFGGRYELELEDGLVTLCGAK